jgi:predicted enzyme related to lactoylglutathione lyase
MPQFDARLAGVELYFENLESARTFYAQVLGLPLQEYDAEHHAKFGAGDAFVCLEKRGVEDYASADKAVLFLEVEDLRETVERIDSTHVMRAETSGPNPWAAIRDPEGHTVLVMQRKASR